MFCNSIKIINSISLIFKLIVWNLLIVIQSIKYKLQHVMHTL